MGRTSGCANLRGNSMAALAPFLADEVREPRIDAAKRAAILLCGGGDVAAKHPSTIGPPPLRVLRDGPAFSRRVRGATPPREGFGGPPGEAISAGFGGVDGWRRTGEAAKRARVLTVLRVRFRPPPFGRRRPLPPRAKGRGATHGRVPPRSLAASTELRVRRSSARDSEGRAIRCLPTHRLSSARRAAIARSQLLWVQTRGRWRMDPSSRGSSRTVRLRGPKARRPRAGGPSARVASDSRADSPGD